MGLAELNVTKDSISVFNTSLYENSTTSFYENYSSTGSINEHFKKEITTAEIVFNFFIIPLLTFFGLYGNTSTVVLFFLKEQKTASVIFIIGLAISDLMYIFIRLIGHIYVICELYFAEVVGNVKPNSFFWVLMSKPFQQIGYLFVLVITIERISAVWFPLQHRTNWTTRRSRFISAVIVILPLGNLVMVVDYLMNGTPLKGGPESTLNEGYKYINALGNFVTIWSIIYRMIFETLPLPLVLIFNIVIIIGIRKSSFSKQDLNSTVHDRSKREDKITKMLLVISVLFVLQCGPLTVLAVLIHEGIVNKDDFEILAVLLHVLMLTNHAFNFIVYGFHDSSFRRKICKACGCQD